MSTLAPRGFTIIEVMLFLAVTGMLTAGILIGSSTAIAQQRYKDSVSTLKGFIQEQYSEASNTSNVLPSQGNNPTCKKSGNVLTLDDDTRLARGTSDCLRLGRYLLIEPTKITVKDIIGLPPAVVTADNDIDVLKSYTLGLTSDVETKDVAWSAKIVQPHTSTSLTTTVLIMRSPLSGSILTFVHAGNQRLIPMVDDNNMDAYDLCVDSQSVSGARRQAVRINQNASGQSAVEIPLETANACD